MTAAVVVVVVVVVPCSWSCLAGPSWLWRVCWKKIKYSRHCLASSLRSAALGVRELLRSFCGERIECMLARRSICLLCLLAGGSHDADAVVAPSAEQTRRWTYDALKKNKATIKKKRIQPPTPPSWPWSTENPPSFPCAFVAAAFVLAVSRCCTVPTDQAATLGRLVTTFPVRCPIGHQALAMYACVPSTRQTASQGHCRADNTVIEQQTDVRESSSM